MKRLSTLFLKIAIITIVLGVTTFCIFVLPTVWREVQPNFPSYSYAVYAVLIALYAAALPFYIACYNAWKLLKYINKGDTFTTKSVKTVRNIALSAGIICAIYIFALPFFYIWGDLDDAPGLIVIGMVLVGAPMIVAVFGFLLQKLLGEATELKSENELTV